MAVSQIYSKWKHSKFESFKFKGRIKRRAPADGNPKGVDIVVPLNIWLNFEELLKCLWLISK